MRDGNLRGLLWLAGAQAAVTLLAGLNLVIPATAAQVGVGEFVRWREMFSLLVVTPASGMLMILAVWVLERGRGDAGGPIGAMALAVCLVGISMGVHEPTNVLQRAGGAVMAESLYFWDEVFSHAVFFAGYAGVSLALLWSQARNPLLEAMGRAAFVAFLACGVVTGAGIFFSLARAKEIRADLAVIAAVIALSEWMRRGRPFGRLPLQVALESGYALALAGLAAQRILGSVGRGG